MAQSFKLLPGQGQGQGCPSRTNAISNTSSLRPNRISKPQRTYTAKRVKRASIESNTLSETSYQEATVRQETLASKSDASPPPNPTSRSFSDFFRPIPNAARTSSPTRRYNQSSPLPSSPQTVPSSPPSLYSADEKENQTVPKKRLPRRLNSKPHIFHQYATAEMENNVSNKKSGAGIKKGESDSAKAVKSSIDKGKIPPIRTAGAVTDETSYHPGQTGILPFVSAAGPSSVHTMGSVPRAAFALNVPAHVGNMTDITINIQTAQSLSRSPIVTHSATSRSGLTVPSINYTALASLAPNADVSGPSVERDWSSATSAPIDIPRPRAAGSSGYTAQDPGLDVPRDEDDARSVRSMRSMRSMRSNASSNNFVFEMSDDEGSKIRTTRPARISHGKVIEREPKTEADMADIRIGFGVDRTYDSPHGRPAYKGPRGDANTTILGRGRGSNFGGDGACSDGRYSDDEVEASAIIKRKREESVEAADVGASDAQERKRAKQPKLVQSTLNLVAFGASATPTQCTICKYIQNDFSKEGNAAHKKVHDAFVAPINIKGYKFSGAKCPRIESISFPGKGALTKLSLFAVTNKSASKWKKLVERIVKRAEADVSAWALTKEKLWESIEDDRNLSRSNRASDRQVPRFTVFLAVKDNLVVSIIVIERIFDARVVNMVPCDAEGEREFVDGAGEGIEYHDTEYTNKAVKTTMGVHYMWTHERFRQEHIATSLLDRARAQYIPGVTIERQQVAFSNLTDAGKHFVARYVNSDKFSPLGNRWTYREYATAS